MEADAPCPEIRRLLQLLEEGYRGPAWHGPNLRSGVWRVDVYQASWRPTPTQRNLWEIMLHAAYWKYIAWRRITGAKRGSFPVKGSDWFLRPDPLWTPKECAQTWKAEVALLDAMHTQLRETVAALAPEDLARIAYGQVTVGALISGVAMHDAYHAGQMQTIRQAYRFAEDR